MKTKMKWTRILALGLVIVMLALTLVSCGGTKVADANGDAGALSWSYTSDTKTLKIMGSGAMPEFESAEDVPWAAVRAGVQKIVVGDGVTSVGDYAFYGMNVAAELELPETVVAIGDFAFAYSAKLEAAEIPAGVTNIGKSAFEGCSSLSSIFIPASVTEMGERAFAFCYSMTSAVIASAGLKEIGSWTFKNCSKLENLVISNQLTGEIVADDAFEDAAKDFDEAEVNTNPNGESTITIHYVTEGETETVTHNHAYGKTYHHATPAKDGYTADVSEVSGTANGADRTVTVTYTKVVEEEPEEKAPEEEEEKEEKNMTTIVIGIVIFAVVLIGIGVGAFFLLRSDKNKNAKKGTTVRKDAAPKNGKKK